MDDERLTKAFEEYCAESREAWHRHRVAAYKHIEATIGPITITIIWAPSSVRVQYFGLPMYGNPETDCQPLAGHEAFLSPMIELRKE